LETFGKWAHNHNLALEHNAQRAFAGILATKCFAMAKNLLDHVQADRSAYAAAKSPDSFGGRWRITPVPLGRRG
jgi:hypothetical protein